MKSVPETASKGAALPYVLGLLFVLSLGLNVLFRDDDSQLRLSYRRQNQIQSSLLVESGLSLALSKYNSYKEGDSGLSFETSGLSYWLEPQKKGFEITSIMKGLYGYVESKSRLPAKKIPDYKRTAWVGQHLNWQDFPAICLTNKQGNLVLAGNASIEGNVLLWQGNVRKATSRKVRFSGSRGHRGDVLDSNSRLWENIPVDLNNIIHFMEKTDVSKMRDQSAPKDSNVEKKNQDVFEDEIHAASGSWTINSSAVYKNSEFYGDSLIIENGSKLINCIVYARSMLLIQGEVALSGQFLSGDSIKMNARLDERYFPSFFAKGRLEVKDKDSSYIGGFIIENTVGTGVFIFGGHQRRPMDSREHIVIDSQSKLKGLVYAKGNVNFQGSLNGSLICENLRFTKEGTTYLGHLYNAKISFWKDFEGEPKINSFMAPLIFRPTVKAVFFQKSPLRVKEKE